MGYHLKKQVRTSSYPYESFCVQPLCVKTGRTENSL